METGQLERLLGALADGIRPAPNLTVSEWADRYRVLSPQAASEHGPWQTSRTPYLREPMDALSANSPLQEVVLVFGSQLGKSESVNNWIGYTMDICPAPTLIVQPTIDLAKRYSKMRIGPMIDSCPTLKAKIKPPRDRDGGNTLLLKEYPSGMLILGGANAASGLASMPIRYLGGDEIDRWPGEVDDEGSPIAIVEARTRTFGARKKVMWTSTPTLLGQSHVWDKWLQSDQRHYHVPCPHCGHYQTLTWEKMCYDENDPELKHGRLSIPPVMMCENCGTGIPEIAKARWYQEDLGRWVAENPEAEILGYHLPAFYSPLGWQSWDEIIVARHRAGKDPAKLRPWVNTVEALPWAEETEAPDWEALYRRREPYPIGVVPEGGLVLTMAVDVQRDRLECEVVAWGENLRSWSVEYIVLRGNTDTIEVDPLRPCPWRDLERECARVFPTSGGARLGIERVCVDSGDQTQVVYAWVRKQASPRIVPIKGRPGLQSPVGTPSWQDVTVQGRRTQNGVRLWPLGVDHLKRELYGWLHLPPPLEPGDPEPRGFCHWPDGYGQEYFQGLTAEEQRRRLVRGFPRYEWAKVRDRNEPLDVRVYNRAAAIMLGLDRWGEADWAKRRAALQQEAERLQQEAQQQAPPAPRPRRRRRAVSSSL